MTAFTAVNPQATALVCTGVNVTASSDTINGSDIINGGVFIVTCAATPTNVTFTDPGRTAAGTVAGTVTPVAVAANTSKAFGKNQLQGYIDPATNTVAAQFSATTNVTAMFVV